MNFDIVFDLTEFGQMEIKSSKTERRSPRESHRSQEKRTRRRTPKTKAKKSNFQRDAGR